MLIRSAVVGLVAILCVAVYALWYIYQNVPTSTVQVPLSAVPVSYPAGQPSCHNDVINTPNNAVGMSIGKAFQGTTASGRHKYSISILVYERQSGSMHQYNLDGTHTWQNVTWSDTMQSYIAPGDPSPNPKDPRNDAPDRAAFVFISDTVGETETAQVTISPIGSGLVVIAQALPPTLQGTVICSVTFTRTASPPKNSNGA